VHNHLVASSLLAFVCIVALAAGSASAQTRAPADKGRPAAAQAPTPTPASKSAEQKEGPRRTETVVYDSWTVICQDIVGVSKKRNCTTLLRVADQRSRQVLFSWIVGMNNDGKLTTVFQTPTGVALQKGLELKIENGQPRRFEYVACVSTVCEANAPMEDALVREALAAGANGKAVVTVHDTAGRTINFNLDLKGFDKALAALRRS
jgi:invasion protein IalB